MTPSTRSGTFRFQRSLFAATTESPDVRLRSLQLNCKNFSVENVIWQNNQFTFYFRSTKDALGRSEDYFIKEIIYLGRIFHYETENEHLVTAFQQFLDQTSDTQQTLVNATSGFSFSNIIEKVRLLQSVHKRNFLLFISCLLQLSPNCEDLFIKCFFKSKTYKCNLPYLMMEQRLSSRGFCCSFNYKHRNDDNKL